MVMDPDVDAAKMGHQHPAKHRQIRTVLQEIMYCAAQVILKARQWWLDLGRTSPVAKLFEYLR
jgi:hypothetical protein